jgi:hypothetical protein
MKDEQFDLFLGIMKKLEKCALDGIDVKEAIVKLIDDHDESFNNRQKGIVLEEYLAFEERMREKKGTDRDIEKKKRQKNRNERFMRELAVEDRD